IALAREAARLGRFDEAVQAYTTAIAASPDSPFLHRELAAVLRQQGAADAALEEFGKAAALDPTDAKSLAQIGEILESHGEFDRAAESYAAALAIEPDGDVERKLEELRSKSALALLPAEYRAIDQAPQITRGDLAALIAIRLGPLLQSTPRNEAALITD